MVASTGEGYKTKDIFQKLWYVGSHFKEDTSEIKKKIYFLVISVITAATQLSKVHKSFTNVSPISDP